MTKIITYGSRGLLMTIGTYLDRSRVRLNLESKVEKTSTLSPPNAEQTRYLQDQKKDKLN